MLIKNFYSRVGTADWESIMTAQARKDMLNTDLYSMRIIGEKEQLNQLKKEYLEQAEKTPDHDEAVELISKIQIRTKYDRVMETIEDVFKILEKRYLSRKK